MAYDCEILGPRFDSLWVFKLYFYFLPVKKAQHLYSYVLFNPNQKRVVMMGISQTQRTSCFVKGSKW